jgi:hypothetical protein
MYVAGSVESHRGDSVLALRRAALGAKSEFPTREIDPTVQPLTITGWGVGVMSGIVRRIKWIAVQCAAIALVALATNALESAGALTSHSAAVTQPKPITVVDRSGKGDRLIPLAAFVLPRGCESSVSSVTNLSRSDLVWRCDT